MGLTDNEVWVCGDMIRLHECDNCNKLVEGWPCYYWEEKDFSLCIVCITEFANIQNQPKTGQFQPVGGKKKIPDDLKWKIWERDNFTCQYCESRKRLSVDHIVPESSGGSLEKRNLVTACVKCNTTKGARTPEEAGMVIKNDPREG